jgi:hypothetical protein
VVSVAVVVVLMTVAESKVERKLCLVVYEVDMKPKVEMRHFPVTVSERSCCPTV